MNDDDFERIQKFLESQDNLEMQFLQKFDQIVSKHINEMYDFSGDEAKENFLQLHVALSQTYNAFSKNEDETIKNFCMVLVLIKNTLEKLKEVKTLSNMLDEDRVLYIDLMRTLIEAIKEQCNEHIKHFNSFIEYIDNFIVPINIEN